MITRGFHPTQFFSIDTAEILMKGQTGLNHLMISAYKYHSYKMNIRLIKLIGYYCYFGLWKFQQSLRKPVVLQDKKVWLETWRH